MRGDQWQYRSRWGWRKIRKNPTLRARRNAVALKEFLQSKSIEPGWVQGVVVWAGDGNQLTVEDSDMPVWKISELQDHIPDLWRQHRLTDEQINQIRTVLEEIIEQDKAT